MAYDGHICEDNNATTEGFSTFRGNKVEVARLGRCDGLCPYLRWTRVLARNIRLKTHVGSLPVACRMANCNAARLS